MKNSVLKSCLTLTLAASVILALLLIAAAAVLIVSDGLVRMP